MSTKKLSIVILIVVVISSLIFSSCCYWPFFKQDKNSEDSGVSPEEDTEPVEEADDLAEFSGIPQNRNVVARLDYLKSR